MDDAPKMTETEIFKWGTFKAQGTANSTQANELEKLDSKWRLEKIDFITKALEKVLKKDI